MIRVLTFALLALSLPMSGAALDCLEYGEYPHVVAGLVTDSSAHTMTVDGDLAYFSGYSSSAPYQFHIATISDPQSPELIATLEVPYWINDVLVAGTYAYVVGGLYAPVTSILQIIDIADPTAPQIVGTLDFEQYIYGVTVSGDLAYIAGGWAGVLVVDIADPTAPELIGNVVTSDFARRIEVAGDTAYVAAHTSGLQIVDIADAQNPAILASVPTTDSSLDLTLAGDYCFVANGEAGLSIINVAIPTEPHVVGQVSVDDSAHDIAVDGDFAYIAGLAAGLQIVDIDDVTDPHVVGTVDTGFDAQELEVVGDHAFVASSESGLQVVDLANRAAPPLPWVLDLGSASEVAISGHHAIVVGGADVQVVDVADPTSPQLVGSVAVSTNRGKRCVVEGSLAYITRSYSYDPYYPSEPGGLDIVDFSDPTDPHVVSSIDLYRNAGGLTISGDYVYFTCVGDGFYPPPGSLQIVDVSNPTNPLVVGQVEIYFASDVALQDDIAYVSAGAQGLMSVDVSDPANPQIIQEGIASDWPAEVVVADGYAYITGDFVSVVELDGTGGGSEILQLATVERSHGIVMAGDHAYISSRNVVNVADISEPHAMAIIGSHTSMGSTGGLDVSGDYLFCPSSQGLLIAPLQCDESVGILDDHEPEDLPRPSLGLAVHPNPFNPQTMVSFTLDRPQIVRVGVHDLTGRRVAVLTDGHRDAGMHAVRWSGTDSSGREVASGTYILRLECENRVISSKMMLIR